MSGQAQKTDELTNSREKLELAGTLRWFHWLIVFSSLLLTVGAWYFSKTQLEDKIALQFDREADQVVALIVDRMKKYEDALWSGVALIQTTGGEVTYSAWETFATSLRIEEKYPGINGIGVIHSLKSDQLDSYLEGQRAIRPDYAIHPPHQEEEYWPITYVVPVAPNAKAVGLDMAHETNRFTAGKKSRDTGLAQITGPITLVQDAAKTPGFLFYTPYYQGGRYETEDARRSHFVGLVYAPFIVNQLMGGVLAQRNRHVGLRMIDQGDTLYDEHHLDNPDFDAHPLLQKEVTIPLYGRNWTFDIRSTQAFRTATTNNQPIIILLGGLIIDGLLLGLFILISKGSRKALAYADVTSRDLSQEHHRLQAVLDTAVDGIITIDAHGIMQDCNPAASKIFGYSPEEMVGQNVKMLMPSPYHEEHDGYLERYQQTGVPTIIGSGGRELIGLRKDGAMFPMDLSVGEMQCDGQAFYSGLVRDITERKDAARLQVETSQQLIDGAQRLQAVLDTAVDGIITIDAHGIMQDCNPAASKIFGYSPEEMVGQNVKMLMPSPYHEEHDGYLERYQQTGVPNIIGSGGRELIGLRKDGAMFPMDLSVGEMQCDGQAFYSGLVRDITERKEAERLQVETNQQIIDGAQRLKAVLDTAVDGIITIDAHGIMQDCNPAASKIFGYSPEEMVGQNVKMLMPSPYHAEHDGYLERYQETAVPHIIGIGARDLVGKCKDGTTFPMDLSVGEMECDGQIFYSGLVRDITERKEAEATLKAALEEQVETTQQLADGQQRLQAVMDTAVDGIITIDVRGMIQDCNPAATRIFGYESSELIGQNVKMLMPSPYHEEHDGYLERYQETAVPHIIGIGARDLVGKRKDGTTFPMDLSVGEMECDGQTFYSGLVRDITERKEAEAALKETNEELERFAYIASHDLKAPLRVIDNTSKWLEEDLAEHLTGDNRENMDLMRSRVARMEKLLDDLLEYSRVGRATDDRYQERVNGATLVSEIVELLAPPEEFAIKVSPTFASIHVIKMPLQQILLNLINNALKHHDQSHGLIQVGVEDQGAHYRFTVTDDGPGIPHAFHEQVFDMFQTLKPRDQVEGSGMGLALVKKHIDLVGGTVHLESVEGEGSMFTIHWPKQYAMEEQPA